MNQFPSEVKQKLESIISGMSEKHWLFSNNPGHDFTRQHLGKLNFADTVRMIIGMGKGTTNDEIISYFKLDADRMPSQSAFNQRRGQISLSAFEYLFSEFATSFPETTDDINGKSVLACDGTHIVYSTNPQILEDYNKPHLIDHKGYNHMHLNALVAVGSKAAIDVVIQPGQEPDERDALHTMMDHFSPDNPDRYIFTADRGYESYDLLFHCETRRFNYVFRLKSPSSSRSMLSSYISELPDEQEEFDVTIKRFFTDKRSNIMKDQQDVYRYVNPSKNTPHFYELLGEKHAYFMQFRVVKVKVGDGKYEYLITNLPHTFGINDIKHIYNLRWGCEISFRYIKHAAGMLYFHSRKPEFIKQEIYATLTMYNFGVFLANEAATENRKQKKDKLKNNKHSYEIDFSTAIKTTREYFHQDSSDHPIDIIRLLCKFMHVVKDEVRHFDRPLRGIGAVHFNYR